MIAKGVVRVVSQVHQSFLRWYFTYKIKVKIRPAIPIADKFARYYAVIVHFACHYPDAFIITTMRVAFHNVSRTTGTFGRRDLQAKFWYLCNQTYDSYERFFWKNRSGNSC